MEKEEFLKLFEQCIKDGDIELKTEMVYSPCFGHELVTSVYLQGTGFYKEFENKGSADINLNHF